MYINVSTYTYTWDMQMSRRMFLTDYAGPDRKKRNSGNGVSEWIHIWSLHTLYTIRTHNAVHRKLSSTISAIWLWHVCLTASPSFHLGEIPTYPHNVCNVFKSMIYIYIRTSFFREEMDPIRVERGTNNPFKSN